MRLTDRVEVPDHETWEPPPGLDVGNKFGFTPHTLHYGPMGQYDIPRLLEGGVTAQVFAIYYWDHELGQGVHRGLMMARALHKAAKESDEFELITKVADIHRLKRGGKCGGILSLEGCEALNSDVRMLDIYYQLGLRMASLTHCRRNIFADGVQKGIETGGLTAWGRRAIQRMNELGIVVDLVHINEVGFWEILDLTTAPLVLSHSTGSMFAAPEQVADRPPKWIDRPELVLPRDRERLKAIARNGGVLGIIFDNKLDLDGVVADIEVAVEAMGPDHVGLGSDYFGLGRAPKRLEDISKLPALTRRLVERGHADEVILKILGGNYLRVFGEVWKA
jgi:membrane dipeptidase